MISPLTQMHLEICRGPHRKNFFFKWDSRTKKYEKPWHRGL